MSDTPKIGGAALKALVDNVLATGDEPDPELIRSLPLSSGDIRQRGRSRQRIGNHLRSLSSAVRRGESADELRELAQHITQRLAGDIRTGADPSEGVTNPTELARFIPRSR